MKTTAEQNLNFLTEMLHPNKFIIDNEMGNPDSGYDGTKTTGIDKPRCCWYLVEVSTNTDNARVKKSTGSLYSAWTSGVSYLSKYNMTNVIKYYLDNKNAWTGWGSDAVVSKICKAIESEDSINITTYVRSSDMPATLYSISSNVFTYKVLTTKDDASQDDLKLDSTVFGSNMSIKTDSYALKIKYVLRIAVGQEEYIIYHYRNPYYGISSIGYGAFSAMTDAFEQLMMLRYILSDFLYGIKKLKKNIKIIFNGSELGHASECNLKYLFRPEINQVGQTWGSSTYLLTSSSSFGLQNYDINSESQSTSFFASSKKNNLYSRGLTDGKPAWVKGRIVANKLQIGTRAITVKDIQDMWNNPENWKEWTGGIGTLIEAGLKYLGLPFESVLRLVQSMLADIYNNVVPDLLERSTTIDYRRVRPYDLSYDKPEDLIKIYLNGPQEPPLGAVPDEYAAAILELGDVSKGYEYLSREAHMALIGPYYHEKRNREFDAAVALVKAGK